MNWKQQNEIRRTAWALALTAMSVAATGVAQQPVIKPLAVAKADPKIAAAIAKISPENVKADIAKLVSFRNRSTLSSMDTDLPPGTGVTAAADWIYSEFTKISDECGGCLEVKRDDFIEPGAPHSRITKDTRLQNIYAVLKGTDPAQASRRVLVTGHYDSRNSDNFNTHDPAPGANDDASGVAVSIESARALSKLKFPATIVFVAVAGEEQGLDGSRHLAKLAKSEGWQLEAVLNNDIVGGDNTPGDPAKGVPGPDMHAVRVFSEGVPSPATLQELHLIQTYGYESDSPSREVARAIAEVDKTYFRPAGLPTTFHPVLEFRRDRFGRGGDHSSFNAEGFAAVRVTEWRENFNHQHQDLRTEAGQLPDGKDGTVEFGDYLKFVTPSYTANVARLNAASLATFASAPGEPTDVVFPPVKITNGFNDNFSVISWKAPEGAPADTTYEVVWRPTAAPTWTNVVSAGSALTIRLDISKDNVVFGVRSVDAAGHRSPAVVPYPVRRQMMSPSGPRQPNK
ncbi:M20/M25/M40 family metallo-hydrolase [Granulicella sp. 5B5]|uniref:M20/M25/M40 family metallo-hydrolase n=1 Tax=Granulicella sp. 5B5 TaxID=1617967 RepID=UPI001761B5C7|nr:M20/M25/M40 family metallo-hydrolase [Granulicella sp. 5B5]QMV18574.1 M20/M25/M40 family metallo-hydrolase [Granulicella sp. 5B5]